MKRRILKVTIAILVAVMVLLFATPTSISFLIALYDYDEFESVTYKNEKYYLCEGLYFYDVKLSEDRNGKEYYTNTYKIDVKEQKMWESGYKHRMYMYNDGTENYLYDSYTGLWYSRQKPDFELSLENVERIVIYELQVGDESYKEWEYECSFEERKGFLCSILENRENLTDEVYIDDERFSEHCIVQITYKGQPTSSYWCSFGGWIYENEVIVSCWEKNLAERNGLLDGSIKIDNPAWSNGIYTWLTQLRQE